MRRPRSTSSARSCGHPDGAAASRDPRPRPRCGLCQDSSADRRDGAGVPRRELRALEAKLDRRDRGEWCAGHTGQARLPRAPREPRRARCAGVARRPRAGDGHPERWAVRCRCHPRYVGRSPRKAAGDRSLRPLRDQARRCAAHDRGCVCRITPTLGRIVLAAGICGPATKGWERVRLRRSIDPQNNRGRDRAPRRCPCSPWRARRASAYSRRPAVADRFPRREEVVICSSRARQHSSTVPRRRLAAPRCRGLLVGTPV